LSKGLDANLASTLINLTSTKGLDANLSRLLSVF
jgi:hypothetical protein